jgi:hypothetical protein
VSEDICRCRTGRARDVCRAAGLHDDDEPLLDALSARGVPWRVLAWDDPSVDWAPPALVVIRSTWDYVPATCRVRGWARGSRPPPSCGTPPRSSRGTPTSGTYGASESTGVEIVPTHWLDRGDRACRCAELLDERGWSTAVVKPVVSAGAIGTVRFTRDEAAATQPHLDG